jgi:hypothetical protein
MQRTSVLIGGVTAINNTDLSRYVNSALVRQPHVVMPGSDRSSKVLLYTDEVFKSLRWRSLGAGPTAGGHAARRRNERCKVGPLGLG